MKVLVVGGSPAFRGGVETFCHRSKAALEKDGRNRVDLLSANTAFFRPRRASVLLRSLASVWRRRGTGVDVLWLQYANLPDLLLLQVAKLAGLRVMVTPHLGLNWKSQRSGVLRAISGWLLKRADRLALISPTQELELNLPRQVPRSLIRIFMPPETWTAPPPVPSADPQLRLLHAARLSADKGTFLLLDVCKALKDRGANFRASLVGKTDEATMNRIQETIRQYGLETEVELLGYVPDAKLLELLRASDVLVHLSKVDSYPLVVLESIAHGVFPVCMDLAGARDMVTRYAGQVVPQDRAAEAMIELLTRRSVGDLRAAAAAAAPLVRADYAWPQCVKIVEEALALTKSGQAGGSVQWPQAASAAAPADGKSPG